ncbi:MAG: phosphatidate cytidylyltransferase [Flavobacteriales bacterium]|nr:phosphatidate cytidylyltransferase [Flavobacteriales bacterium]
MKELGLRALTGAVYVLLTLGAAWAGPVTTFLLYLPVCLIGLHELHRLLRQPTEEPPTTRTMLVGATVYLAVGLHAVDQQWNLGYTLALSFLMLLITITWSLWRGQRDPGQAMGQTLCGLLLVAVPFGLMTHFFAVDRWMFIGFMILLWTNDTGAYLVGRAIGRTPLLPAVSPKKTIEGLLGGIALTLGVAWMLGNWHDFLSKQEWLIVGGLIALTATLGDLLESAFKRARGVKDSGRILPGHGGILDRFDGFLLAVPAVVLYLQLIR